MQSHDPETMGGHVDNSDPNAPKEIKSTDLTSLEMGFYLYDKFAMNWSGSGYHFLLKEEDGKVILSEDIAFRISCEVEPEVMEEARKIIDQQGLVSLNGEHSYTNGLPSEFQTCYLSAKYASGESLSFSMDGNPESEWANAFVKYFRTVFANHGFAQAFPPESLFVLDRFDFQFNEGDTFYTYGNILVPSVDGDASSDNGDAISDDGSADYVTCIWKYVWSKDDPEGETKTIRIPDGYFDRVQELILELGLYDIYNGQIEPFDFHSGDADFYGFCIETEDGRQFNGWFQGEDIPPEMEEIKEKVKAFMDPIFEEGEEYSWR